MRRTGTAIALTLLLALVVLTGAGCSGNGQAKPTEDVRAVPAGTPAMYEFFTPT